MYALIKTHAALLIAGLVSFVLMGAGQSLYGPALPAFVRDLGLTPAQAGWLVSAHWIGSIFGVATMFAIGKRITPRAALAMMAAGAGLIASTPGWGGTLAGAVLFGAGYCCATVVFNPRVLAAFGNAGPSMLSLLNAVFSLGAIAAPLVFVALGSSPALTFGIVAAACAAMGLFAGAAGKPQVAAQVAAPPFRLHIGILAFGMVSVGLESCLIGLGPTALILAGETEAKAAQLLSLFFLAYLAARVALVFAAKYVPSFTLYALAMTGASLAAVAGAMVSPAAFFVLLGASVGLFFPCFFVTASRKMGANPRVPPTIVAAGLVGGILSPVLMASVLDDLGKVGFFWIIAGIAGAAALAALAVQRPMNR